jgi:enoyl-CoA hydratase/carnithine racemase
MPASETAAAALVYSERAADGVALITLHRPDKLNAMSHEMLLQLDAALAAADDDPEVSAIVVTGSGRALSAGLDMSEIATWSLEVSTVRQLDREALVWRWAALRKPFLVAVNGLAHGAGAILAVAADIRIGSPASEFRFTAIHGNYANNTWHLPKLVGVARATEYILTGRVVGAAEAERAGLLNHVVPADRVRPDTIAMAAEIAANAQPEVLESKRLIRESVSKGFWQAFNDENAVCTGALRPGGAENEHIVWWTERAAKKSGRS